MAICLIKIGLLNFPSRLVGKQVSFLFVLKYLYSLLTGTKLTYPGEGDEEGMRLASDVIFVIKEKPHTYYRREGNNLVYDINITLPEALEHKSLSASVPLIEGGVHRFVKLCLQN